MKVLGACSLGGVGHLIPLLPFLDAARVGGHETLVVVPPALAAAVVGTEHDVAVGGEPAEDAVAPIREQLPVVSAAEASVLANRELFGRLATAEMLGTMDRVMSQWRPDLVLRDPCEYASAVVAHRHSVATAQVAISLAEVEWGAIGVAAGALEEWRPGVADELRHSPYATRFPASIDPSPFPDTLRFAEPVTGEPAPLPDWWDERRAPLVYVSFGTVLGYMSLAADAYRTLVRAVSTIDARVLITVGRRFDPSQLGPLPDNVHVEPWVDQRDVLAVADVVVCHGGSGTTLGTLAAGVPLVIVPLFADQVSNGPRIAATGAGVSLGPGPLADGRPRPISGRDAPRITEAIATVLGTDSFRDKAQQVAAEMAASPKVETIVDALLAR